MAGMSAFDSSLGTGLEQVGLNVLVYLSLLVLVLLTPGSYGVFQNPPGPCCLKILYIMVSLAIFLRLCRDVHPRWLSRLVISQLDV